MQRVKYPRTLHLPWSPGRSNDDKKGKIGAQVYHSGTWHGYLHRDFNLAEKRSHILSSKIVYCDIPRTDRLRFYLRLNGGGVPHTEAELDRVRALLVREGA